VVTADVSDLDVRGPSDRYALEYKIGRLSVFESDVKSWMFALFTDREVRHSQVSRFFPILAKDQEIISEEIAKREIIPDPILDAIEALEGDEDEEAYKD
jgi:hypothetical protein